jgi:hypothetical protein
VPHDLVTYFTTSVTSFSTISLISLPSFNGFAAAAMRQLGVSVRLEVLPEEKERVGREEGDVR